MHSTFRHTVLGISRLSLTAALLVAGGCLKVDARIPRIPDPNIHVDGPPPGDPNIPPPPDAGAPHGRVQGAHTGGYDSLAHPRRPVILAGWLADGQGRGVPGATLRFYADGQLLAEGLTDAAGLAQAPWTPTAPGVYAVTVKVLTAPQGYGPDVAHARPGEFVVSCQSPPTPLVVVDLDDCVFESLAKRRWLGNDRPNPGASAALGQIGRRYPLVYLTRQSDLRGGRTRRWLRRHGFPDGPILQGSAVAPVSDAAALKSASPAALAGSFPKLYALVTERTSDAQAFAARGAQAYLFVDIDPDEDDPDDLYAQAARLRGLPANVNAVYHWQQVQTGVLSGQAYPAAALARQLEAKARRIRRHDR